MSCKSRFESRERVAV